MSLNAVNIKMAATLLFLLKVLFLMCEGSGIHLWPVLMKAINWLFLTLRVVKSVLWSLDM